MNVWITSFCQQYQLFLSVLKIPYLEDQLILFGFYLQLGVKQVPLDLPFKAL